MFRCDPAAEQLSNARRTAFYRVIQEALASAAPQSKKNRVTVGIQKVWNGIRMDIIISGGSFRSEDASSAEKSWPLEFLGMRERIEMVGGTFNAEFARGASATLRAKVPLK